MKLDRKWTKNTSKKVSDDKWLQQVDWNKVNNLVLINPFRMGILDWTGVNDCLHCHHFYCLVTILDSTHIFQTFLTLLFT